ncbi:MAG TPA: hypothetical protein EYN38_05595 [Flavobacteriales bacterium]|nr:hypothetical protein [Flavobacteriales bacterium]
MARVIICDVCDATYTEVRYEHQTVELNGKNLKVYLDIDNGEYPGFSRLDVCPACRKQVLIKVIEQEK